MSRYCAQLSAPASSTTASLARQQSPVGDVRERAFAAEHGLSHVTRQRLLPRWRPAGWRRVDGQLRAPAVHRSSALGPMF